MAQNELKTKLKLDSSEFESGLQRSKKQVNKFNKDTKSIGNQIKASFNIGIGAAAGFGAALVGIGGVSAAFDTLLNSNQKFGDSFNNTLTGCKTVFNDFVSHLANADLTGFAANIENAFKAGIESAKAYDQLGNTKMSYNVASARKLDQLSDVDAKLAKETDTNKRAELISERQTLIKELRMFANTLSADVIDALSKSVNASLGGVLKGDMSKVFSDDMFNKASELDLDRDNRDAAKSEAEKFYKEFNNKVNPLLSKIANIDSSITTTEKSNDFATDADKTNRIKQLNQQRDSELKKINNLTTNLSEKERQHLLNYITLFRYTDEQLQSVYSEMQGVFNANRVINRIEKREPKATSNTTSNTVKKGKVAVSVKVDTEGETEDIYDMSNINAVWEGEQQAKKDKYNNGASSALLSSDSFKELQTKNLTELPEPKQWDLSSNIDQTLQLGNAISSMTNSLNIGGNSWVSYGANIIGAVAAAIPAIMSLVVARKTEATANSEAAITGAAASVASIPVVGWLMAGAAVASVIAAIASVPKFATGGVVSGNSYSGDKIPALLNSGEIVLNQRQQSNLFNQLDRNSTNNQGNSGLVEFKIKGDNLVGILSKQNKKTNRV